MTMVKFNRSSQLPNLVLSSFFDDFFGRDQFRNYQASLTVPSVNVVETKDDYKIELAAPGYQKDDFKVSIENNVLKISAQIETTQEENNKHVIKEYHYASFERSFTLPDTIVLDNIQAKYENGILQLVLPKKEEAKLTGPRNIAIG